MNLGSVEAKERAPFPGSFLALLNRRDAIGFGIIGVLGLGLSFSSGGTVALLMLLGAIAVAFVSPVASVAAIAAAAPFIYQPVALRDGQWSLLELAIVVSAIAVSVHVGLDVIRSRSLWSTLRLALPLPTFAAALLLVIAGAVSLLTVADPRFRSDSVRELRWVIVEPVIAFLLFRWAFRVPGGRSLCLVALAVSGVSLAIVGIAQIVTQTGVVVADGVERATGPYQHPNNLALYLDRVAVMALGLAVSIKNGRKLLIGFAVLCGLGLAATLSRGAALAYIAGATWVVAMARVRRGWLWIGLGIVASAIVIAAVGADRLTDTGAAGSKSSRELIWSASVDMIRDHPITGVGLDQFVTQYGRRYVDPAGWAERYTSHPHNLVLDIWLRLGVTGLIVFTAIVAAVISVARRPVRGDVERGLWIGATGALIAGVVHGMLDNGYFLPDLAVLTWLMIATIESTNREPDDEAGETDG